MGYNLTLDAEHNFDIKPFVYNYNLTNQISKKRKKQSQELNAFPIENCSICGLMRVK